MEKRITYRSPIKTTLNTLFAGTIFGLGPIYMWMNAENHIGVLIFGIVVTVFCLYLLKNEIKFLFSPAQIILRKHSFTFRGFEYDLDDIGYVEEDIDNDNDEETFIHITFNEKQPSGKKYIDFDKEKFPKETDYHMFLEYLRENV